MSMNQLGNLKRKKGRFVHFPLDDYMIEAAIDTGFIKDATELRYAVIDSVSKKTMNVKFVLDRIVRSRPESKHHAIMKQVFHLEFPYDPDLWIDTTSD